VSANGPRTWFLAWIVAVTALSLLPLDLKYAIGTKGALHDAGHVAAFAITTLLYLGWRRPLPGRLWMLLRIVAFAFVLEAAQSTFFHNHFEWRDIATDSLGIAVAAVLYILRAKPGPQ
jgi:hypothetical protein